MSGAKHVGRYPHEMRVRKVQMVFEHHREYPSQRKAIESISKNLNVDQETFRIWFRLAETDGEARLGLNTDERAKVKDRGPEVK